MARTKAEDALRKRKERKSKKSKDDEIRRERIRVQRRELVPRLIASAAVMFGDNCDRAATFLGVLFEGPAERAELMGAARRELAHLKGNDIESTSREIRSLIANLARMTHAAAAVGDITPREYANNAMRWADVLKKTFPATADDFDGSDLISVEPERAEPEEADAAARWERTRKERLEQLKSKH